MYGGPLTSAAAFSVLYPPDSDQRLFQLSSSSVGFILLVVSLVESGSEWYLCGAVVAVRMGGIRSFQDFWQTLDTNN